MKKEVISELQKLHFSQNEAKVYSALLEIGQTSAGQLIKKTVLHRAVVYDTLDKLVDKKLIFALQKNNIMYFQATDPSRLLQIAKAEEDIAKNVVNELRSIIGYARPEITVYEGLESYRQFFLDSLDFMPVGGTNYIAGSIGEKWFEYLDKDADKYLKQRIAKKIKWKMIVYTPEFTELELAKKYPELNQFKLIRREGFKYGNFNVFEDHSIALNSATEPMIIHVKNQTLVKIFTNLFDLLWEMGEDIKI